MFGLTQECRAACGAVSLYHAIRQCSFSGSNPIHGAWCNRKIGLSPAAPDCLMQAWHEHESELRGWLRHRMADRAEADDLVQDLFIKAMRQGEHFCSVGNARAWLFEVARNALADRLRLKRETVELPQDLAADSVEADAVDSLAACLPRVLSELNAEDREAITLCDIQGLSQQAFARLKGLSLPGAKSRVQRARKRLRQQLTSACQVRFEANGQVSDFVPRTPLA